MNLWIGHKERKQMAKETVKNYSAEQEAQIRAAATADSPLDLAGATALAKAFGKEPRSVIAKAVRMGVPYRKQTPVTKTGDAVVRKETLVEQIGEFVPGNLDGLEKASKEPLKAVLATLKALAAQVEPAEA